MFSLEPEMMIMYGFFGLTILLILAVLLIPFLLFRVWQEITRMNDRLEALLNKFSAPNERTGAAPGRILTFGGRSLGDKRSGRRSTK
jgi:hypothetical protein